MLSLRMRCIFGKLLGIEFPCCLISHLIRLIHNGILMMGLGSRRIELEEKKKRHTRGEKRLMGDNDVLKCIFPIDTSTLIPIAVAFHLRNLISLIMHSSIDSFRPLSSSVHSSSRLIISLFFRFSSAVGARAKILLLNPFRFARKAKNHPKHYT